MGKWEDLLLVEIKKKKKTVAIGQPPVFETAQPPICESGIAFMLICAKKKNSKEVVDTA